MFRRNSRRLCQDKVQRIKEMRAAQATQFATVDGWQKGVDTNFDAFVAQKRTERQFDEFDQRVERGYQRMLALHKAEVWNAHKRDLKSSGGKLTYEKTEEVRRSLEERTLWLRDVFTQIDADYRCPDETRNEAAAKDISRALAGEPGDFMEWVYDRKRDARSLGPKGAKEQEEQDSGDMLPNIMDAEVTRYSNLKMKMTHIRDGLVEKYGAAGLEHWDKLQSAKDLEYNEKMDRAASKWKELQEQANDNSYALNTQWDRELTGRVSLAQKRFKASMEMEEERERLMEAHQTMNKQRFEVASDKRRQQLQIAAKLKAEGKNSEEVKQILQERKRADFVDAHNRKVAEEQEDVLQRKTKYLTLIKQMKKNIEVRDGERLMQKSGGGGASSSTSGTILMDHGQQSEHIASEAEDPSPQQQSSLDLMRHTKELANARGEKNSVHAQKRALWDVINSDKYQDPFLTIHKARLQARKNYDPVYRQMSAEKLGQNHEWNKGQNLNISGTGGEKYLMENPRKVMSPYEWGMSDRDRAYLNLDGDTKFTVGRTNRHFSVFDEKTADIDLRFESKRKMGSIWTGPKFYKMGAADTDDTPVKPY